MFDEVKNVMARLGKDRRFARHVGYGLAASLLIVLSGDGIGAGISPQGIDPLDVLDLQVKPNVIIVLDSSGSMQEGLYRDTGGGSIAFGGDWRESKMGSAKTVLSQVITDNASKATYLFGQYTQANSVMQATGIGNDRFDYFTTVDFDDVNDNKAQDAGEALLNGGGSSPTMLPQCAAPWNTPCEVSIRREPGSASAGSVTISPSNNRFEWRERITTVSPFTFAECGITLSSATHTEPFAALITEFNTKQATFGTACVKYGQPSISATAPGTTLTLSWDAANRRFILNRGGSARVVQLLFGNANSVAPTLGLGSASLPTGFSGPGPGSTNCNATTFANTNWYNTFALNGSGVTNSRGFQAWQWITPTWNRFYFTEGATSCPVIITPKFYARGQDLGDEIALRMNACARPATANIYTVTYATTTGRFTWGTTVANKAFTLQWTSGPSNIGGALAAHTGTTGNPQQPTFGNAAVGAGGTWQTPNDSIRLLRRSLTDDFEEVNFDPDLGGPLVLEDRITYRLFAGKFFNGETFYVHGDGSLCGVNFTSPVKTDPPSVRLQQVSDCNNVSSTVGAPVSFGFGGGTYGGNSISCNGFQANVKLTACDAASNISLILPNLEREFPVEHNTALPAFGTIKTYQERQDGSYAISTLPATGGVKADGSTPIANSLIGIRTVFGTSTATGLWGAGQADDPLTPTINEARGPIRLQASPREPTLVMFVTDGDDTCANGGSGSDDNALRAAAKAEDLYRLIEVDKPESSVTTYVIGFGTGASTNRLNWIAWGGSGLGQGLPGQPQVSLTNGPGAGERWNGAVDTPAILQNKRAQCTTCVDAFIAPDAATLAKQLQSILDKGAGFGEFTAQASVFTSIPELVKELDTLGNPRDPDGPNTRYLGLVPNLFRSTFQMPGFKGQLKAFQNTGGQVSLKWNAGQKLYDRVNTAMATCLEGGGGAPGECRFTTLQTKINRRLYTSSRNGVFTANVSDLTSDTWLSTNGNRTSLWPPSTLVAPIVDSSAALLDAALGLPLANTDPIFAALQSEFGACRGANLAAACAAAQPLKTQRARREAREIILAYMAGARVSLDTNLDPKHVTGGTGEVLFVARDWMLADSTLATPAVIGPPIEPGPDGSGFEGEYELFRDGYRDSNNKANNSSGNGTRIGFGLRNPDKDADHTSSAPDTTLPALKPAMTVAYVGANDMLHAFRGGPSCNVPGTYVAPGPTYSGFPYTTCAEKGGEELWGFVPFDQLGKLRERLQVQTRANHTYMLAAGLRFADVFVPNPGTTSNPSGATQSVSLGSSASATVKGVWRRVLVFGRGIGGKYLTALDVTSAGSYKTTSTASVPPAVLWSRGNPDTQDGTTGGTMSHDTFDETAYARMGETWSVPTIAYVDRASNPTARKGAGVDFVMYLGSGYGVTTGCPGSPCEGQTFFTLDTLTGDVVAAADVPPSAGTPQGGYANALVANAVAYNEKDYTAFAENKSPHPAAGKVTRAYIGDLHGRLWKFNAGTPATPYLVTDLGIEQPIAAAVTVLGLKRSDTDPTLVPHLYVNTGYDRREDPEKSGEAFVLAGIVDDAVGDLSPADACQPSTVVPPCLFKRELIQDFNGTTGYFRGTTQPASILVNTNSSQGVLGRVFFAATRFNAPNTTFAPAPCTGPSCNPVIPCRSSFDSAFYALGAVSGDAAFDLNASGDDAVVIFDNSKIAAVGIIAAPEPTGGGGGSETKVFIDEGLASGTPPPANTIPEGGNAPGQAGSGGVTTAIVRTSSTICQ